MLRFLIGTGILLMAVGFGAAGWQYWQGLAPSPDAATTQAEAPPLGPPVQSWLISATGGLVAPGDVQAFLVQDRLVADRMVTITLDAPLGSLLAQGEALPAQPFLPVFADVRAPLVARSLCPVLTESVAAACAVHSARLVEGSLDVARNAARFRVELAYRLDAPAADLPDLALHVLVIYRLPPVLPAVEGDQAAPPPERPASAEAALAAALAAATAPCAAPDRALGCRLMRLSVDWSPGAPLAWQADLGWIAPLPDGVFPVTPIAPPPEG